MKNKSKIKKPNSHLQDRNIVLIGFMGCGKTTIARALAKKLNMLWLDTDELISQEAGMSIKKIFDKFGEQAFRKMEKSLSKRLKNSVKGAIISTGGGFIKQAKPNKIGTVIWLKAEFSQIEQRLNKKELKKRPLFKDKEAAKRLFNEREVLYNKAADIIIPTSNLTPKQIVKKIRKAL